MSTDDFDWSPLGESFWRSAAESCQHKPSELQLRFACLKHSGLNATDSARGAGYQANDDEGMRQQGSRAAKTTAVCELLAYAHAETGKGDDGIVSGKEAKRILSRISRKGNNNERIKALEALSRLDQWRRQQAPINPKSPPNRVSPSSSLPSQRKDSALIWPCAASLLRVARFVTFRSLQKSRRPLPVTIRGVGRSGRRKAA